MAKQREKEPWGDWTGTPEAEELYEMVSIKCKLAYYVGRISPYRCFHCNKADEAYRGYWAEIDEDYLQAANRIYAEYAKMVQREKAGKREAEDAETAIELLNLLSEKMQAYPELYGKFAHCFGRLFFTEREWETPSLFREQKGFNPSERLEYELFQQAIVDFAELYDGYTLRF